MTSYSDEEMEQLLEDILQTPPADSLSPRFASKVTDMVRRRQQLAASQRPSRYLGAALLLIVIAGGVMGLGLLFLRWTDFDGAEEFLRTIGQYKYIVVSGLILFLAVQYLDLKLLRLPQSSGLAD